MSHFHFARSAGQSLVYHVMYVTGVLSATPHSRSPPPPPRRRTCLFSMGMSSLSLKLSIIFVTWSPPNTLVHPSPAEKITITNVRGDSHTLLKRGNLAIGGYRLTSISKIRTKYTIMK